MKTKRFTPMNEPYVYGMRATRNDGITVEVVRCYEGEWTVFLTRSKTVVACSLEYYRHCGHGNTDKSTALRIAGSLVA